MAIANSYKKAAGGIDAITSTMSHTFKEAGVIKGTRALLKMNQRQGFDCPGCAWPEPSHRAVTEFCENGAKALADIATTKRVDPVFFANWTIENLRRQSDIWLNDQGRITHPMVKRAGADHYEPIEWPEAFALVATHLNKLSSPHEAVFYTSGRTSNEAAYLYQLFARHFGTNNLPDCSNMCHESSGTGMGESIGVGKGTVSLADFDLADAILVIGQNPGTNHPRMLSTLQSARRRGCEIISVNPLREVGLERFTHPQEVTKLLSRGEAISSLYLQVKIGGDIALIKGLMKELLKLDKERGNVVDGSFIDDHTSGFTDYRRELEAVSWDEILSSTGLSRDDISACATILANSKRIIACWAMGLTQHEHGVGNIQEVVNLMLMLGQVGKPGAGLCPVRGHSNVQGDRTMGIYEKPKVDFLNQLKARYGFEPPREHGYDTVDAIKAMRDGRARVFVGMGGNFLSASPDTDVTAAALEQCDLSVHIATKLNRVHLAPGATSLILPTLNRVEKDLQSSGEQFVSVEDSMSVVHSSRGHMKTASPELMSEPSIVAHIAHATFGDKSHVDWLRLVSNYDFIRDEVEQVIPGFERFNERVRLPDGFVLPNNAAQRRFVTSTSKANFVWHDIPTLHLQKDQLLMMTIRSHDQFNTTVYSDNDRYRGVRGNRMILFMNEDDMRQRGLSAQAAVSITSHFRDEKRTLPGFSVVPYNIPKGCSATYFPESNPLVPLEHIAKKSGTPASKSVVITVALEKRNSLAIHPLGAAGSNI